MNRLTRRVRAYFAENKDAIIARDWKQMRYMSLWYTAALLAYYLLISLPEGIAAQNTAVLLALAVQTVFSAVVWSLRRRPRRAWVMTAWLLIFGTCIAAAAAYVGDFVFTDRAAWLFPVVLILLTQIYTVPPRALSAQMLVYLAVFLLCSYRNKPESVFVTDLAAGLTALTVSAVSYITILRYKVLEAENQKELVRMCSIDAMTGMLNKNTFIHLYHDYVRSAPADEKYALAVLDIDHFKSINDRYGHMAGDEVLCLFAATLSAAFPDAQKAIIGRFGGDEFVILLKDVRDAGALQTLFTGYMDEYSGRVRASLGIESTGSCGIVVEDRPDRSFSSLFLAADRCLYRVKNAGGSSVCAAYGSELKEEKALALCINVRAPESGAVREALRDFWILEAFGTPDSIRALERYGESLSAVVADADCSLGAPEGIVTELTRLTVFHPIPVVLLTADGSVPKAWARLNPILLPKPAAPGDVAAACRPDPVRSRTRGLRRTE